MERNFGYEVNMRKSLRVINRKSSTIPASLPFWYKAAHQNLGHTFYVRKSIKFAGGVTVFNFSTRSKVEIIKEEANNTFTLGRKLTVHENHDIEDHFETSFLRSRTC